MSRGGYVPDPIEYERPGPAPEDPFTDPDEINAVLELTRQSIDAAVLAYRADLIAAGWSTGVAEQMAAQLFKLCTTARSVKK